MVSWSLTQELAGWSPSLNSVKTFRKTPMLLFDNIDLTREGNKATRFTSINSLYDVFQLQIIIDLEKLRELRWHYVKNGCLFQYRVNIFCCKDVQCERVLKDSNGFSSTFSFTIYLEDIIHIFLQ